MYDIIKITKSLEDLGVLTDGVTEKVKHELGALLAPLTVSLVQPISVVNR